MQASAGPPPFAVSFAVAPSTSAEDALAFALAEAAREGQWAIVAQLADELEARRRPPAGGAVVPLRTSKR